MQSQVDKLSTETPDINGNTDVDSFKKMEIKIAEMSKEIANINKTVNVTIKENLKEIFIFMQEEKEKQKANNNPNQEKKQEANNKVKKRKVNRKPIINQVKKRKRNRASKI